MQDEDKKVVWPYFSPVLCIIGIVVIYLLKPGFESSGGQVKYDLTGFVWFIPIILGLALSIVFRSYIISRLVILLMSIVIVLMLFGAVLFAML